MPIQECTLESGGKGWKYGGSGKCYPSRAQAEKQMRAEFANGYTGDCFAFDKGASGRSVDQDGHLHVARSIMTRSAVNPYYAEEIPDWQELGLEAGKTYQLYRSPEELEKATPSLNGKPLLLQHKPVTADDHPSRIVVGSVSNPEYANGDVTAELVVWSQDAIDEIEDGSKKQLSCGYRYTPVMEAGTTPDGEKFDGRMTQIKFNHVALVSEGRVDGAVVGDSMEEIQWQYLGRILSAVLFKGALDADWEEGKHPRADNGQFGKGGGGGKAKAVAKPAKAASPVNRAAVEQHKSKLQAALGKSDFNKTFNEIANDPQFSREDAVELASQFLSPIAPSSSRNKALQHIAYRHNKLVDSMRAAASIGKGGSAPDVPLAKFEKTIPPKKEKAPASKAKEKKPAAPKEAKPKTGAARAVEMLGNTGGAFAANAKREAEFRKKMADPAFVEQASKTAAANASRLEQAKPKAEKKPAAPKPAKEKAPKPAAQKKPKAEKVAKAAPISEAEKERKAYQKELDSLTEKRRKLGQRQLDSYKNGTASRARTTTYNANAGRMSERIDFLREQLKSK